MCDPILVALLKMQPHPAAYPHWPLIKKCPPPPPRSLLAMELEELLVNDKIKASCQTVHEYNMTVLPALVIDGNRVPWKPIMHFDVTILDDVKAPIKLDRFIAKRKSRCRCDARGRQVRFARDEIINLTARN